VIAGSKKLKQLPLIDVCIKMLHEISDEQNYTGEKKYLNPYIELANKLSLFKFDMSFPRARHLWLAFYRLNLPPAKEIESVLVARLFKDDKNWKYLHPPKAPPLLANPTIELFMLNQKFIEIEEELKGADRKANKGDVYDAIALHEAETGGENFIESGDSVRKRHERLRKKVKNNI